MALEQTLSIIKPDAVSKNYVGGIISKLEQGGLKVIAAKMTHLTQPQAEEFYEIHRARPFFKDLVTFMVSGPVVIMALEGEDAVLKNRDIMGATDPQKAAPGTIRKEFAETIDENAVHGSDSLENAQREIAFFFKNGDLCKRTR